MNAEYRAGRAWAYFGAVLGGIVSIAANVAHSFVPNKEQAQIDSWAPQPGYVIASLLWPVFAFIGIEVLARVDWAAVRYSRLIRWAGVLPVAAVAAVVSYRHLSGLLTHYGEDALVAGIGPLAVDGIMFICTVVLIATADRAPAQLDKPAESLDFPPARPTICAQGWPRTLTVPARAPRAPEPARPIAHLEIPTIVLPAAQPRTPEPALWTPEPRPPARTNGRAVAQPVAHLNGRPRTTQTKPAQPARAAQSRTPRTTSTSDDVVREAVATHRAAHPDDDNRATARAVYAAHPGVSNRALGRALGDIAESTVRGYLRDLKEQS